MSVAFLSHLGTGRRTRVAASHACQIEDALNVPRGTFFELTPADAELLDGYLPAAA